MEDAHIAIAPFTDKKLALFGVFDGHGGSWGIIQERKWQHSWKNISHNN